MFKHNYLVVSRHYSKRCLDMFGGVQWWLDLCHSKRCLDVFKHNYLMVSKHYSMRCLDMFSGAQTCLDTIRHQMFLEVYGISKGVQEVSRRVQWCPKVSRHHSKWCPEVSRHY